MNKNFMEKSLLNKCANILEISVDDVSKMFELNIDTNSFIRRRIFFGINSVDDNIGFLLKGLLDREVNDLGRITEQEISYIKDMYNIDVQCMFAKKPIILSERKDPLVLGIRGETLLREFAKVLGITRNDASKLIKSNQSVKAFMLKENSLSLLNQKSCISVLLQNTLGRRRDDFSMLSKDEIINIYNKYGIIIGNINEISYCKVVNM